MKRSGHAGGGGHHSSGLCPRNRLIIYSFLSLTSLLLLFLIVRHYDYDQRYHANQETNSNNYNNAVQHLFQSVDSIGTSLAAISSNQPKPKPKIAYIFAGSARSFICPKVHWSLRFNAIDALGGDPYVFVRISAEDNLNTRTGKGKIWTPKYQDNDIEEALKILNPLKIQYFSLEKQIEEMSKYYPGEAHEVFRQNDLRRYSMFFQRSMGYKLALDYETEHNIKFDWIALIRLDAAWSAPVLPIESYSNDRVWLTETGYVAYNDQFMLIPRQYSDYLFDLNTKVDKRVYCLGGPDVETWKCNATYLATKGVSPQKINTTLSYCCPDVFQLNMIGYSETIHYRHFLYGQIPVGFGHLPVYITRYLGEQCRPDCDRLMYNFKLFAFSVLQKKYPFMAKMNGADSRASALSLTDTAVCFALTHEESTLWRPPRAAEFHQQQALGKYEKLDYSKSLYEQLDKIPKEMIYHVHDFLAWRIHPTINIDGCLAFDGKSFVWQDCVDHLKRKGGFRHFPQQTFLISLTPHHPVRMNTIFASHQDPWLQAPYDRSYNFTRIMVVQRDVMGYLFDRHTYCMTIGPQQHHIEMKDCVVTYEQDPNQWFEVNGEGPGSHPLTTVAKMKSVAYPNLCIARGNEVERDQKIYIQDSGLNMRDCDSNNPQILYFEFELLQA